MSGPAVVSRAESTSSERLACGGPDRSMTDVLVVGAVGAAAGLRSGWGCCAGLMLGDAIDAPSSTAVTRPSRRIGEWWCGTIGARMLMAVGAHCVSGRAICSRPRDSRAHHFGHRMARRCHIHSFSRHWCPLSAFSAPSSRPTASRRAAPRRVPRPAGRAPPLEPCSGRQAIAAGPPSGWRSKPRVPCHREYPRPRR